MPSETGVRSAKWATICASFASSRQLVASRSPVMDGNTRVGRPASRPSTSASGAFSNSVCVSDYRTLAAVALPISELPLPHPCLTNVSSLQPPGTTNPFPIACKMTITQVARSSSAAGNLLRLYGSQLHARLGAKDTPQNRMAAEIRFSGLRPPNLGALETLSFRPSCALRFFTKIILKVT